MLSPVAPLHAPPVYSSPFPLRVSSDTPASMSSSSIPPSVSRHPSSRSSARPSSAASVSPMPMERKMRLRRSGVPPRPSSAKIPGQLPVFRFEKFEMSEGSQRRNYVDSMQRPRSAISSVAVESLHEGRPTSADSTSRTSGGGSGKSRLAASRKTPTKEEALAKIRRLRPTRSAAHYNTNSLFLRTRAFEPDVVGRWSSTLGHQWSSSLTTGEKSKRVEHIEEELSKSRYDGYVTEESGFLSAPSPSMAFNTVAENVHAANEGSWLEAFQSDLESEHCAYRSTLAFAEMKLKEALLAEAPEESFQKEHFPGTALQTAVACEIAMKMSYAMGPLTEIIQEALCEIFTGIYLPHAEGSQQEQQFPYNATPYHDAAFLLACEDSCTRDLRTDCSNEIISNRPDKLEQELIATKLTSRVSATNLDRLLVLHNIKDVKSECEKLVKDQKSKEEEFERCCENNKAAVFQAGEQIDTVLKRAGQRSLQNNAICAEEDALLWKEWLKNYWNDCINESKSVRATCSTLKNLKKAPIKGTGEEDCPDIMEIVMSRLGEDGLRDDQVIEEWLHSLHEAHPSVWNLFGFEGAPQFKTNAWDSDIATWITDGRLYCAVTCVLFPSCKKKACYESEETAVSVNDLLTEKDLSRDFAKESASWAVDARCNFAVRVMLHEGGISIRDDTLRLCNVAVHVNLLCQLLVFHLNTANVGAPLLKSVPIVEEKAINLPMDATEDRIQCVSKDVSDQIEASNQSARRSFANCVAICNVRKKVHSFCIEVGKQRCRSRSPRSLALQTDCNSDESGNGSAGRLFIAQSEGSRDSIGISGAVASSVSGTSLTLESTCSNDSIGQLPQSGKNSPSSPGPNQGSHPLSQRKNNYQGRHKESKPGQQALLGSAMEIGHKLTQNLGRSAEGQRSPTYGSVEKL